MATITKRILSASTNGKQVLVTGESNSQLTTLHQAVSGTTDMDEIYLYAYNSKADDVDLTIYWGATGQADEVKVTIPFQAGRYLISDGKLLNNNLYITAFCSSGGGINIDGYVNRFDY